MLVGKAVDKSISTYINGVQLKNDATKVHNVLKMEVSKSDNAKVTQLEETVNALEKENMTFKTRLDLLQKQFEKLNTTVEKLYPKQSEINILDEKGEVERRTETYNSPDEFLDSERKNMREILLRGKSKKDQEMLKDSVFVFDRTGKMTKEQFEAEAKNLKQKGLK